MDFLRRSKQYRDQIEKEAIREQQDREIEAKEKEEKQRRDEELAKGIDWETIKTTPSADNQTIVSDKQQVTIKSSKTKSLQPNSNEMNHSGLLTNPRKKDSWFEVIDDMTKDFYEQNKKMPNETQAWTALWETPPKGYKIVSVKDQRGEDCLEMPSIKSLSRSAFGKRWKKYTANKTQ